MLGFVLLLLVLGGDGAWTSAVVELVVVEETESANRPRRGLPLLSAAAAAVDLETGTTVLGWCIEKAAAAVKEVASAAASAARRE